MCVEIGMWTGKHVSPTVVSYLCIEDHCIYLLHNSFALNQMLCVPTSYTLLVLHQELSLKFTCEQLAITIIF